MNSQFDLDNISLSRRSQYLGHGGNANLKQISISLDLFSPVSDKYVEVGCLEAYQFISDYFFSDILNSHDKEMSFYLNHISDFLRTYSDSKFCNFSIIDKVFVRNNFRGRGLAKKMINDYLANFSSSNDVIFLHPSPLDLNFYNDIETFKKREEELTSFYLKLGFNPLKGTPILFYGFK